MQNPETNPTDAALASKRLEIERRLGHLVLLIQVYEETVRQFIVNSIVEGTPATIDQFREKREKAFKNHSLGKLATELMKNVLTATPFPDPPDPENLTEDYVHHRFSMEFSREDHATVRAYLKTIVELRNGLVHKLVKDYAIDTDSGCDDALVHLEMSRQTVQGAYEQMKGWAGNLARIRSSPLAAMTNGELVEIAERDLAYRNGGH